MNDEAVDREANCETPLLYKPLTPAEADLKPYEEILEVLFHDDEIRNIAITGGYSSGKSSLMRAIIKNYKFTEQSEGNRDCCSSNESEHRFLTVSLTPFCETNQKYRNDTVNSINSETEDLVPNEEGSPDNERETLDVAANVGKTNAKRKSNNQITHKAGADPIALLESQIINQIIHRVDHSKVPNTKFKKTTQKSWAQAIGVAAYVVFTILYFLSFANELLRGFPLAGSWMRPTATIIWCVTSIGLFAYAFKRGVFKKAIRRIAFQGNELELFDNEFDSKFDRYMDEIVYMINGCGCDVIVFEDLDRFDNVEVFSKLREINELVNEMRERNRKGKNKVQPCRFFYLIKDELMTSRDRTKFFDLIIPVVPYVDYSNAYSNLKSRFSKNTNAPEQDCLRDIALYLDDNRLLDNIVNEYNSYFQVLGTGNKLGDKEHRTKLFSLIAYKNLFPGDFAKLQFDSGYLYDLITHKEELISKIVEKCNSEIDTLDRTLGEERGKIQNRLLLVELKNDSTLKELLESINLSSELEKAVSVDSLISSLHVHSDVLLVFENRKKEIFSSEEFSELVDKTLRSENRFDFEQKLEFERIKTKALYCDLKTAFEICNELRVKGLEEYFEKGRHDGSLENIAAGEKGFLFVQMLLVNGYIDNTYRNYISHFREGALTSRDHDYLMRLQGAGLGEYDSLIENPSSLVEQMDESMFHKAGARNFYLFDYLCTNYQTEAIKSKANAFFNSTNRNDASFFADYLTKRTYPKELFWIAKSNSVDIASMVISSYEVESESKREVIVHVLLDVNPKRLSLDWKLISDFIVNDPQFLSLPFDWIDANKEKAITEAFLNIERVVGSPLRFKEIDFEAARKLPLKSVYDNNRYLPSSRMLQGMLSAQYGVDKSVTVVSILQSIMNLKDSPIKKYLQEEINYVLATLFEEEWDISDTHVAEWVLNNSELDSAEAKGFVKRLQPRLIADLGLVPQSLYSILLEANAISVTLQNAVRLSLAEGEITEEIGELLLDVDFGGVNEGSLDDFNQEDCEAFFYQLFYSASITGYEFDVLVQKLNPFYSSLDFNDVIPEKLAALVKHGLIEFNTENYAGVLDICGNEVCAEFGVGDIDQFYSLAMGRSISISPELFEEIKKLDGVSVEQYRNLASLLSEQNYLSLNYSDNANLFILEGDLTSTENDLLPELFEKGSDKLKEAIRNRYLALVNGGNIPGNHIPSIILLELLEKDIPPDLKMRLFAKNIERLNREEVIKGLTSLKMHNFARVVGDKNPKKKTKIQPADAVQEIANQLCKHGFARSWHPDRIEPRHTWLYRLKSQ